MKLVVQAEYSKERQLRLCHVLGETYKTDSSLLPIITWAHSVIHLTPILFYSVCTMQSLLCSSKCSESNVYRVWPYEFELHATYIRHTPLQNAPKRSYSRVWLCDWYGHSYVQYNKNSHILVKTMTNRPNLGNEAKFPFRSCNRAPFGMLEVRT